MITPYYERYHKEDRWYNKVILLEVYHTSMSSKNPGWTIQRTADFFNVSIGLVSENLSLAEQVHKYPELMNCESRIKALKRMNELVKE